MVYRHYCDHEDHFYKENFKRVCNTTCARYTKPFGGFWGTPEGCHEMWEKYCKQDLCRPHHVASYFEFILPEATICTIANIRDLYQLPVLSKSPGISGIPIYNLDFEAIHDIGIDALEVYISKDYHNLYHALYGWDVDSVFVLNPDKIKEVNKQHLVVDVDHYF